MILSKSKWLALFAGIGIWIGSSMAVQGTFPREELNLDSTWRFIRQDVSGAQNVAFNDSTWGFVDLPHTWNNLDGQDGGNNYYRGVGWYRRHCTIDNTYAGRRLFLNFDGASLVADVYVNGTFIGQHRGGFSAFVFDVTSQIVVGGDNVIAAKVSNAWVPDVPPLGGDFNVQGGIHRGVRLLITDPVHISPLDHGSAGVYLTPANVSATSADLQITTLVSNANSAPVTVNVVCAIADASSNVIKVVTNMVTLPPESLSNVAATTLISNPHLWNGLADPYLYSATVQIWNGANLLDAVTQPLGFRSFSVDPNQGFFLNGQAYPLRGVCMHEDWLDRGWAIGAGERLTNFALVREIGATVLRLAHWQHGEESYQLADQYGIVVESEVPLGDYITESTAFYDNTKQQMREMIRQNYNHPCIVFWGLFNEITQQSGPSPNNLVSQLGQLVAAEDPTRISSAASSTPDASHPVNWYSEVTGFNKYHGWYSGGPSDFGPWVDGLHSAYSTRHIGVTEYGAGASIYQHSEDPVSQPVTTGTFHPEEWQNLVHEAHWQQIKTRPYLWGTFVWNMFDFPADDRDEGDMPGRNDKGLVTFDRGVCKDSFYWYKANWTANPMVYITGHTFTNRLTSSITAKVYANCDSVELILNGVSKGVRTSANRIFAWPITLIAGHNTVQAMGTKGGASVMDTLQWTRPGGSGAIQPIISIQPLGNGVRLSWPASGEDWRLQCKSNSPGGIWMNVTGPMTNPYVADYDLEMGAMLYRLVLTNQ